MKVLSLFSGIGAFEKALTNMGVNYELVNYCEIDKYASKSYSAIHNVPESKNLGDITKVDTSKLPSDIDLITYGFPCQDISLAGRQRGFEHDGERTRSGLFFEALRLIEDLQPKFAICENVKNLTGKKFAKEFDIVLSSLEEAGYKNYWQVLNAKDYGIPQNRERVFIISIREDIDKGYEFPEPFPLELRLKDMLDAEVDDKYYLSEKMIKYISSNNEKWTGNNNESLVNKTIASTLNTGEGMRRCDASNYISNDLPDNYDLKNPDCREAVNLNYYNYDEMNRVYDPEYLAPTLRTMQGGNRQPKVAVREFINENNKNAKHQQDLLQHEDDICRCIPAGTHVSTPHLLKTVVEPSDLKSKCKRLSKLVENTEFKEGQVLNLDLYNQTTNENVSSCLTEPHHNTQRLFDGLRIRKLTPKECYRLMGFSDEDFYKAEKVNSNTQLYKQAGNSIVVDVIEELYEQLFSLYWDEVK